MTSPFMPYLAVTFALNLPPLVWGIKAQLADDHCETSWLLVNGILCLAHIVAAIYIAQKVQEHRTSTTGSSAGLPAQATVIEEKGGKLDTKYSNMEKAEKAEPATVATAQPATFFVTTEDKESHGEANSMKRLTQVMCYDCGVAIYIIAFIVWAAWISKGVIELMTLDVMADCDRNHLAGSIICGWIYMMVVCCAFACSLICLRR